MLLMARTRIAGLHASGARADLSAACNQDTFVSLPLGTDTMVLVAKYDEFGEFGITFCHPLDGLRVHIAEVFGHLGNADERDGLRLILYLRETTRHVFPVEWKLSTKIIRVINSA